MGGSGGQGGQGGEIVPQTHLCVSSWQDTVKSQDNHSPFQVSDIISGGIGFQGSLRELAGLARFV